MQRTIVVGFDGSAAAKRAVDWAVGRARLRGCRLHLVTCVVDDCGQSGSEGAVALAAAVLEAETERIAHLLPASSIGAVIQCGEAAEVLARLSHQAGMVVVGSDRPGDLHGEGFGAVDLQLAIQCNCTVVVVPNTACQGSVVVVGVDGSPEARKALHVAAGEAQCLGWGLVVVHAGTSAAAVDGKGILASAVSAATALHPHMRIRPVLAVDRGAAWAIAASAAGAGLMVVGSRGRGSIQHMQAGALGTLVSARLPCPLMITIGAAEASQCGSGAGPRALLF